MGNTHANGHSKTTDPGLLILRAGVGILFLTFGWQKIQGGEQTWAGVGSAMQFVGISFAPLFWGLLATVAEFAGGLLLAAGLFTRGAAIFLALTMTVAFILKVSTGAGIMDWYSPLTFFLISVFFALNGGGAYSLDHVIRQRKLSGGLTA